MTVLNPKYPRLSSGDRIILLCDFFKKLAFCQAHLQICELSENINVVIMKVNHVLNCFNIVTHQFLIIK